MLEWKKRKTLWCLNIDSACHNDFLLNFYFFESEIIKPCMWFPMNPEYNIFLCLVDAPIHDAWMMAIGSRIVYHLSTLGQGEISVWGFLPASTSFELCGTNYPQ